MEIGYELEVGGGTRLLLKDRLLEDGVFRQKLDESILKLQFLQKMIPIIRDTKDIVSCAILIETLKYGILGVTEKSLIRRVFERLRAKVDSMYSQPIPSELLKRLQVITVDTALQSAATSSADSEKAL